MTHVFECDFVDFEWSGECAERRNTGCKGHVQKRNSLISVDDALAAHSLVQNQHTSQTNVLLFEMILRKVVPAIHTEFNNKAALRLTVTNLCAVRRRHLRDHAQCGATPFLDGEKINRSEVELS